MSSAKLDYDTWTKMMLSEVSIEKELHVDLWFINTPFPYSNEKTKKANDLIMSTLCNETWCNENLKKMTKEQYLKWRHNMVKEVRDSICFTGGFILSFYQWNKYFKCL